MINRLKEDQGDDSLREHAARIGCTASYLSQVYNGVREPSGKLLDHLGLERETITIYRPKRRWR